MTNQRDARPEPTAGTRYDTYLVPRSKTEAKTRLYETLLDLGWRFDAGSSTWWTPEADVLEGYGVLEYDATTGDDGEPYLGWARIQPPSVRDESLNPPWRRPEPLLALERVERCDEWDHPVSSSHWHVTDVV